MPARLIQSGGDNW